MIYNREQLDKLIEFIKELIAEPENQWVKEKLFSVDPLKVNDLSIPNYSFHEFFKNQKKIHNLKARIFYKGVKNIQLRNQLIADFQEMLMWKMLNNIERQYLFIFYQIENMINYYLDHSDPFNKIKINPKKFIRNLGKENGKPFIIDPYKNFFQTKENELVNNKIIIIPIWPKLVFWFINSDVEDWFKLNKFNFDIIINIRNMVSHRDIKSNNSYIEGKINELKTGDDTDFSFSINILNTLKSTVAIFK